MATQAFHMWVDGKAIDGESKAAVEPMASPWSGEAACVLHPSGYGREGVRFAMEAFSQWKFTGIRLPAPEVTA